MILISLAVLLVYWIALALFGYYQAKKMFKKYHNVLRIETPESYQAFLRMDFGKWDEKAILRRTFTRFPATFTYLNMFFLYYATLINLQRYLKFPSSIIKFYRRTYGAIGFKWFINVIQQFDANEKIQTPIIASNHTTWLDIIYFGTVPNQGLSFVSKKQVNDITFLEPITSFLQCIMVDRSSPEARRKVLDDILQRVDKFKKDPQNNYPIVIFPEGTVSNGRSLMEFKNGAFEPLSPITLYSLRYECKQFHMGDNEMTMLENAVMVCCVNGTLRVRREIIHPNQNQTVESYRQRCQKRIAQIGGFKIYNCDYKDYISYDKEYKKKIKQLKEKEKNKSK